MPRTVRGLLLLPVLLLSAAVLFGDLTRGEDLLIQRKYAEAAAAIESALPDLPVEQRARGVFLLGHARLLAGEHGAAIAAFESVQREHPGAVEADASRFLQAKAHERDGDLRAAARIYRDEVERLVGLSRKEEVAATYLGLAEKAIASEPPQHGRAVTFFDLALDLGLPDRRAEAVRLRAAESLLAAGRAGEAIPRLEQLLPDVDGPERARAMLALGRAKRETGDRAGCRVVLRDLRDLDRTAEEAAEAAYEIALSYGVPAPAPAELDRAVAALRLLQREHAGHEKARVADYLVARCQAHCGRAAEALASLRRFLVAHGDSTLPEIAAARAMVGDVLVGQQQLEDAIAAYAEYLRRHPAHGDWERVQRAIVDAEFGIAAAAQAAGQERYGAARELFEAFVAKYPLDARNPDIHARLGDMLVEEKKFDAAREAYARCVAKYPGKPASSRAQFEIGRIHEHEKFDFEAALAAYRAVTGQWQPHAQHAIARLTQKHLELRTERVFQTDEEPVFTITSRNIEKVRVRVYRLALEDYFRATHTTGDIGRLDIEIIAPDKTFEDGVESYRRHQQTRRDVAIGFAEPGAYVVKVDDRELEATTMVLVSDLALISKSNRHEFFVFTQDTREQAPRAGVRVVLSDGSKVLGEGVTGADGVFRWRGPELQQRDRLVVFAVDASGSGASSLPLSGLGYSPGLTPKGYLYTDRPLYRAGQRVHLKGIVREVEAGLYRVPAGAGYRLHVTRPNGRPAFSEDVEFTPFGTFATAVDLPADAEPGSWNTCVSLPGTPECTFHGSFEVGHYERPRLSLAIDLVQTVVFRGEQVQGRAIARHFYGEPAAGKSVTVVMRLPDGAEVRHDGTTNALGEVAFRFPTTEFAEEALAALRAEIAGENVRTDVVVPVVTTELTASVRTTRPVYLADEAFAAEIAVVDRSGKPLVREATVVLSRLESDKGRVSEVEVGRQRTTTAADGTGSVSFRAGSGGEHRLRVEVQDRFGTLVTGVARVDVSGDDDLQKVRLLCDRDAYRTGEAAAVKVMNRAGSRLALLCWQGDGILSYESRVVPAGESTLRLPIRTEHAPNFALALAMIDGSELHTAERDFRVERDLRLTIELPKTAAPGAEVEVAVVAKDAEGRPVSAEVSLALVDEALLAVAGGGAPPIAPFFHGELRETAFRTASSCTWTYLGTSRPVSDELLAEERRELRERLRAGEGGREGALMRTFAGDELADRPASGEPLTAPVSTAGLPAAAQTLSVRGLANSLGAEAQEQLGQFVARSAFDLDAGRQVRFFRDGDGDLAAFSMFGWESAVVAAQQTRTDFRETGAWIASLVTDADGRATARITLPHSTTSWQMLGKGVTVDTQVGEATATLTAKKSLQVDIVGPPLLVEGDETEVRLGAHNLTDGEVDLELSWRVGDAEPGAAATRLDARAEHERLLRIAAGDVRAVELQLTGIAGDRRDEVATSIPVLPFGVEMLDGSSGSTRDRARLELGLPPGREYRGLGLAIEIGPDPGRDLIAAALELGFTPQNCRITRDTNLALASRGLSVLRVLAHVEATGGAGKVELERLRRAAQSVVTGLVGRQRDDGALAWVGRQNHDLRSTCQAVRFFAAARARGLTGVDSAFDKATEWLMQALRTAAAEARTDIVWALAEAGKVRFESLNSLHRVRTNLSADALARLALAFQRFGRAEAAGEVLEVLRGKLGEPAKVPLETLGLATAAMLAGDRRDAVGSRSLDVLKRRRLGAGWGTAEATAAAIAAVTRAERSGAGSPGVAEVTVTCNGKVIESAGDPAGLTRRYVVDPADVLPSGNRVEIRVEGGGEAFYRAYLAGFGAGFLPDDRNADRIRTQRKFLAPPRRHDGREVPSGFSCIEGRGYRHFQNEITQLRVGESCRVQTNFALRRERDRDTMTPIVVEEPIPAGCSVPRDSVSGGFDHFEILAGRIVFFFRPGSSSGWMQYDLMARFPGSYRVPPTLIQSALRPDFRGYGEPGRLVVHARGAGEADPYRLTPDELLHLGTAYFDAAERASAGAARTALLGSAWEHLSRLLEGWHKKEHHLRDSALKEVARMMLFLGIERGDARTVVRFFEELKDRYPDLVIPFDRIVEVGKSYLGLGEFEAALLVFRATAEASFLKDAAVASVLQQHGEFRRSGEFLARLLTTYPDLATMRVARYSVGQKLAAKADSIAADAPIDERVGTAAELRKRAIEVLREFLVLHPEDPLADEVSFAWATTHVEGKDLERALAVTEAAMQRYENSPFADEFLYTAGYAWFALGRHDEAFAALQRVAEEEFPRPGGGMAESESRWHAVYLQGQIHHARGETEKALAAYDRVEERFGDAVDAADYFRRRQLTLPEVTTVALADEPVVKLSYRNLETAAVQVFKVDLMRLYVTERSLRDIRGIQLHGIRPQLAFEVELGSGTDYRTVEKEIELDLPDPGAYLVVLRSGELLASGMVLRSDLRIEAQEQLDAGRIRVNCKLGDAFLGGAHVKVGSVGARQIHGGDTDLRGVMTADGLVGPATVIVQKGEQYAFYRGTGVHQPHRFAPPAPQRAAPAQQERGKAGRFEAFENNLQQNYGNRARQIDWLEKNVLQKQQKGVEVYRTK